MRPGPGQVLHFSEDPTMTRFVPHVAATARQGEAYLWAVDASRAPDYWSPRQCPRAMAWVTAGTSDLDRERIMGAGCGGRVHAIEYGWLAAIRSVTLYAYRLRADRFRPFGSPEPHAQSSPAPWVSAASACATRGHSRPKVELRERAAVRLLRRRHLGCGNGAV